MNCKKYSIIYLLSRTDLMRINRLKPIEISFGAENSAYAKVRKRTHI